MPALTSVAYSTTIPLDGDKIMPRTRVSGAVTFAPGSVVNGGYCLLPIIADGSSVLTFNGITESGRSGGYLNVANALNLVEFFYLDGIPYFAISQGAPPQYVYPAATAYTLTGPSTVPVGSASSPFTVQSNGTLASAVTVALSDGGKGGTFTSGGQTVTSVTLAANASGNSSATFTYTAAAAGSVSISATNNGGLTNPAALAVTASSAPVVSYVRMTGLNNLTETVDGSGYDYTATNGTDYGSSNSYGVTSKAIPSGAAGFFGGTIGGATAGGPIFGLSTSSAPGTFTTMNYGMYADRSSGNTVWQITANGNAPIAATTAVTIAANDVARLRPDGNGSIYAEVSKDGGQTYTTIYTWTGVAAAAFYGKIQAPTVNNPCKLPFMSSNAA